MVRPNKYAKDKRVVSIRLTDSEKSKILKDHCSIQGFIEQCLDRYKYKEVLVYKGVASGRCRQTAKRASRDTEVS